MSKSKGGGHIRKSTCKANPHGIAGPSHRKSRKPYKRPLHAIEELLGETVKNAEGEKISTTELASQQGVVALYFSAQWCPPCRILTPQLAMLHDELKKAEKFFEVIFISFDYNEENFNQYFSKMPWYAIDYSDSDRREDIASKYGIRGIPVVIFLDATTTEIITMNGREVITTDPTGLNFPWKPEEPPPEDSEPPTDVGTDNGDNKRNTSRLKGGRSSLGKNAK